jgi:hypothetical protein
MASFAGFFENLADNGGADIATNAIQSTRSPISVTNESYNTQGSAANPAGPLFFDVSLIGCGY